MLVIERLFVMLEWMVSNINYLNKCGLQSMQCYFYLDMLEWSGGFDMPNRISINKFHLRAMYDKQHLGLPVNLSKSRVPKCGRSVLHDMSDDQRSM